MPQCFQLFPKGSNEAISLLKLDEIICREILHTEPHPRRYGGDKFDWFNSIGFIMATSNDCELGSQALRDKVNNWFDDEPDYKPMVLNVLKYLEDNYSSTAFYMHK